MPRILCLVIATLLAAPLNAQRPQPEPPPLRGPAVDDGSQNGRGRFTEDRMRDTRPLPFATVRRIIAALNSEEIDTSLRLTRDQQTQIESIEQDYEQALTDYYTEHREELASIMRQAGAERAAKRLEDAETLDGQTVERSLEQLRPLFRAAERRAANDRRPGENEPELTDEQRTALRRLGQIRREAPGTEFQNELLEVLTRAQRQYVTEKMEDLAGRRPRAQADDMMAAPPADSPVKSDRLARLLVDMSPEEQDMLADTIERMRERRQDRRGRPKPAPEPDSLDIPPP